MNTIIQRTITGLFLAALFITMFFYMPAWILSAIITTILVYILCVEWPRIINMHRPLAWLATIVYPVTPCILLIVLNQSPTYHALLFLLVLFVSIHDTSSYIIGSWWGKHKIAPSISPGKTWQGFLGGLLGTYIALQLTLGYQHATAPQHQVLIVTLIICSLALVGDLFESLLKRRVQLKDSGSILPGHGGLLDRLDGVLCVVVFFFIFRNWLTQFFAL